ncbi:hypothetical protein LINGRAHAP2_LOCUS38227 [Linum grandiflorum]
MFLLEGQNRNIVSNKWV